MCERGRAVIMGKRGASGGWESGHGRGRRRHLPRGRSPGPGVPSWLDHASEADGALAVAVGLFFDA